MTHRKLQPSGDHILIRYTEASRDHRVEGEHRQLKESPSVARVVAVGPGQEDPDGHRIPLGLKVGEKIFIARPCGVRIRLHQQSYAVIRKRDLVDSRT